MAERTRTRAGLARRLVRVLLAAIARILPVRLAGPATGVTAVHRGGGAEHPATGPRRGPARCPPTARARGPPRSPRCPRTTRRDDTDTDHQPHEQEPERIPPWTRRVTADERTTTPTRRANGRDPQVRCQAASIASVPRWGISLSKPGEFRGALSAPNNTSVTDTPGRARRRLNAAVTRMGDPTCGRRRNRQT